MFEGIGLAPVCLKLDLDSYDGPWTHVERFQRSSGWLTAVRATIQSEHDILSTRLIAACDERNNPIESWRAVHLTNCSWGDLAECDEHPPEVLDDLLCEEEGAFYARWQREINADLSVMWEGEQRRIEMLEAKSLIRSRLLQDQIADLRRRRRMPGVTTDDQLAINATIADIEAEHDATIARLVEQRAKLRREADIAEEAMWLRSDVLIEFDGIYTVRWTSGQIRPERAPARIWRCGEFYQSPNTSGWAVLENPSIVIAKVQAAPMVNTAKAEQQRPPEQPVAFDAGDLPKASPVLRNLEGGQAIRCPRTIVSNAVHEANARANVLKRRGKLKARAERLRGALELPGSHPKWRHTTQGNLDRLARTIADIDERIARTYPPVEQSAREIEADRSNEKCALPPKSENDLERAMLIASLEELTEKCAKFLPGSPKTQRNLEERVEVGRQIAALDQRQTFASGSLGDDQRNWTQIEIDALRRLWSEGRTAGEIAHSIGRVSRTAVIGKAERLGLPFREQGAARPRHEDEDQLTGPA